MSPGPQPAVGGPASAACSPSTPCTNFPFFVTTDGGIVKIACRGGGGKRFFFSPKCAYRLGGTPSFLCDGYWGSFFSRGKAASGVSLTTRTIHAQFKNEWSYTSTLHVCLQGVDGESFMIFDVWAVYMIWTQVSSNLILFVPCIVNIIVHIEQQMHKIYINSQITNIDVFNPKGSSPCVVYWCVSCRRGLCQQPPPPQLRF
jgi:hypothetical protein